MKIQPRPLAQRQTPRTDGFSRLAAEAIIEGYTCQQLVPESVQDGYHVADDLQAFLSGLQLFALQYFVVSATTCGKGRVKAYEHFLISQKPLPRLKSDWMKSGI